MDHDAHIGLVDAHSEGVGGDNDADRTLLPCVLTFLLLLIIESGVIMGGGDSA